MNAATLLRELEERGARVLSDGNGLEVRATVGSLDARVLDECRALKPQIIELLREREYSGGEARPSGSAAPLPSLSTQKTATPEYSAATLPTEDDLHARYAPIVALAMDEADATLPASLRAMVCDALATAERIIEAESKKTLRAVPEAAAMRLLGDMLAVLETMQRESAP